MEGKGREGKEGRGSEANGSSSKNNINRNHCTPAADIYIYYISIYTLYCVVRKEQKECNT